MFMRYVALALLSILMIGNNMSKSFEATAVTAQESAEVEVLAENLQIPWSIDKEGETFYITERTGTIVKVANGETEHQAVTLQQPLSNAAEAGLLGFTLAPDFKKSGIAYAYYTYQSEEGQFNRLVTLHLIDDFWQEEAVLIDNIPSGAVHHGGRIEIGPDEKLYVTTGDATNPDLAQDISSLAGKILRLNLDGTIPEDNPNPDSYVYSYGHRNPQGITWAEDGTMYATEHGDSANDEINQIEAGQNYGWPLIEGQTELEGLVTPEFTSGDTSTWAPSGMDSHDGVLYVTSLRGNAVLMFDLETGEQQEVLTDYGRIRDVYIEEEYLYFITNNTDGRGNPSENDDKLYRVNLDTLRQ